MSITVRFPFRRALVAAAFLCTAGAARAQFTLSELFIDAPGTDDTEESVEIRGPASTSLTGWFFLAIEGDGGGAGVVDVVQDLGTYSTGTNGLCLIRAAANVLNPAPDVATNVFVFNWTPDLENGSNTFVLGFGTPPSVGTDLDTNNDGTIDVAIAGFTVADAVSTVENDGASNFAYADDFGGAVSGPFAGFNPDAQYRIYNADGTPCSWVGGDVLGTNPGGPYTWDLARVFGGITGGGLDLGTLNVILDADSDGIADACDVAGAFQAFCFGDGSLTDHTTPCPCGNNGAPGNGCGHSFDANGANLSASGSAAADDVVLHSQFEPASSFTLMMQHGNGGDAVFHDGVLCASNPLIRLRGRAAVGGEAFFPNSNFAQDSTTTLSQRGGTFPGSGQTMRYAAWFRNASTTFCPPATANVTNGFVIDW